MIGPATFLLTVAANSYTRGHHFLVGLVLALVAVLCGVVLILTRESRPKPQERPDPRTDRRRV